MTAVSRTRTSQADSQNTPAISSAIRIYLGIWALATLVTVLLCLVPRTRAFAWPLFYPEARFSDLTDYAGKVAAFHAHGSEAFARGLPVFNYFPGSAVIYIGLLSYGVYPVAIFLGFCLAAMIAFYLYFFLSMPRRLLLPRWQLTLTGASFALGVPFLFAVDRGNLETVIAILVGVGVVCLVKGKPAAAAILFGIAVACKPFPAFFFAVLLAQRQYRAFACGIGAAAVTYMGSLLLLGPTPLQAYHNLQIGVPIYFRHYVASYLALPELRFYHGILDLMKTGTQIAFHATHRHMSSASLDAPMAAMSLFRIYAVLALLTGGTMIFTLKGKPLLNQVLGAAIAMTLLVPAAAEYTTSHLLVPVALITLALSGLPSPLNASYSQRLQVFYVCLALAIAPLGFASVLLPFLRGGALLILAGITCLTPFPSPWEQSSEHGVAMVAEVN